MVKNKRDINKNKLARNFILISSILLFLLIAILFISTYHQFNSIENRIHYLQKIAEKYNQQNSPLTNTYHNTESHFRQFTIDYSQNSFSYYLANLNKLGMQSDSLQSKIKDMKYGNAHIYKLYDEIKKQIQTSEEIAIDIQKISKLVLNTDSIAIEKINSPEALYPQSEQEITVKKPFLKRVFSKSKYDTLNVQPTEDAKKSQQKIITHYENRIKKTESYNTKKLSQIKENYSNIRQQERSLLTNNFKNLYEINANIKAIAELELELQKEKINIETKTLIEKSKWFKWQTILSLILIFFLICLIIYYQIYTSYYENRLLSEKQYADKLAEEKSDILAEITHEIRTPINSLIGILDILRKKKKFESADDELLIDSIYTSISNTSHTINDILNLSKTDSKKFITKREFDIKELVNDVIDTHRSQAQIKEINIITQFEEDSASIIFTDEFKIRQILTNLLSNAIKYSNKGDITCAISIDSQSNLIISVADNGIGIPISKQKNIYKKYFTVNEGAKLTTGIGLGLYITKKLVTVLEGDITFHSVPNQGTTFRISIPIPKAMFVAKNTIKYSTINDFPEDTSWLIVDDNVLNLLYLKQFFKHFSNVFSAQNGEEAYEILLKETVDVVITDINMPHMTGDQLLKKIRYNNNFDTIKVVATSSDNLQVQELEKQAGFYFHAILIKPFDEKELVKILNQAFTDQ